METQIIEFIKIILLKDITIKVTISNNINNIKLKLNLYKYMKYSSIFI